MSFEEWLDDQLPTLLRFATVLCGSRDLAQDLVQDVALKTQLRWSTLAHLEHRDAYVRRMLVNQHLSFRRKFARMVLREHVEHVDHDARPTFDQQYADRVALLAELDRLPRRQRAVLVLRYYEGLDDASIAQTLGCGASTVRAHAARALAALRIEARDPAPRSTAADEDSHAH